MRKTYDKLVGDSIPQKLDSKGLNYEVRIAGVEEREERLRKKLLEELGEYLHSIEIADGNHVAELCDIADVLDYLVQAHGMTKEEFEVVRKVKRAERGGFSRGYVLVWVDE